MEPSNVAGCCLQCCAILGNRSHVAVFAFLCQSPYKPRPLGDVHKAIDGGVLIIQLCASKLAVCLQGASLSLVALCLVAVSTATQFYSSLLLFTLAMASRGLHHGGVAVNIHDITSSDHAGERKMSSTLIARLQRVECCCKHHVEIFVCRRSLW